MKKQSALHNKKKLASQSLAVLAAVLFSISAFGQGALWSPAGTTGVTTSRQVFIKNFATVDSSLTANLLLCNGLQTMGLAQLDALLVNGNASVAGSLAAGQILINGNSISSSTGEIVFLANSLVKINELKATSVYASSYFLNGELMKSSPWLNDSLNPGDIYYPGGNVTVPQTFIAGTINTDTLTIRQLTLSDNTISSGSGTINFNGNNLIKAGSVKAGTIDAQEYLLQGNPLPASPWISADTGIVYVSNGGNNFTDANYSTITGGQNNMIDLNAFHGVISGGQNNHIYNATAPAGGHSHSFIGGGQNNSIQSSSGFSVIGGGSGNIAGGPYSIVAGGENNQSTGSHSGILTGTGNSIAQRASHSIIAGGTSNSINNAPDPAIQGYNFIGTGSNNTIEHKTSNATILNGTGNLIQEGANHSVILNGSNIVAGQPNTAYTPNLEIQGGLAKYDKKRHSSFDNRTLVDKEYVDNADSAQQTQIDSLNVITGNLQSSVSDLSAEQVAQQQEIDSIAANLGSGLAFSTGAGQYSAENNQSGTNAANANYSFIGAGHNNLIDSNAQYGAIVAGSSNIIHNDGFPVNSHRFNFIGNGVGNYTEASVNNSSVLNGLNNSVKTGANASTVIGGQSNSVSGQFSVVGGGMNNIAQANYSLIAGGQNNTIQPTAHYSAILSGTNNQIQNAPIGPIQQKNVITGGEKNIIQSAVSNATVVGGSGNTIQSGADRAVVLGGSGITAKTTDAVYVTQLAMNEQGAGFDGILQKATLTSDKSWTLPDKSGMIALVNDISETSLSLSGDTMSGNITMASGTSLTHSTSNGKLTFDALALTNAIGLGYNISAPSASSQGLVVAPAGTTGYPGGFVATGFNASSTLGQGLAVIPAGHPSYPNGVVSLHDGNADGTVHIGTGDVTIGQRINLNGIDKKIRIENDGGDKIILEGINNPSLWETTQGISIAPKAGVTLAGPVMTIEGDMELSGNISTMGTISANNVSIENDFTANKIITTRITSPDSIVHLGDSSIQFLYNYNRIQGSQTATYKGLGLGPQTDANGLGSSAIGFAVKTESTAIKSVVIGSGVSTLSKLINAIPNSLMVGFNTNGNTPTLFVGPANGTANSTGNVGIGTSDPEAKLDVRIPVDNDKVGLIIRNQAKDGIFFVPKLNASGYNYHSETGDAGIFWDGYGANQTAGLVIGPWESGSWSGLRITHDGKIGVGVKNPSSLLTLVGKGTSTTTSSLNVLNSSSTSLLFVRDDGNIGIGTNAPTEKLDVIGTIRACEARVNMTGCPPDFVFESNYDLFSIKKRRAIVLKNKHLLYIMPGKEIEKNGLALGEFSAGILQNVEEHELYLYEHDERIGRLEEQNKQLFEKINILIIENEILKKELKALKPAK